MKMNQLVRKLPDEIENEIKNLVLAKSIRLSMLLDKYPLSIPGDDTFLEQFSIEQLDRIYRYGCVCKIFDEETSWCKSTNTIINEMFENQEHPYKLFTETCYPFPEFRYYWETQNKRCQPSKPEYIRRITNFCNFTLAFSQVYLEQNDRFLNFCEKVVYEMMVGSLIMLKNN
jgi:hypothetical protein